MGRDKITKFKYNMWVLIITYATNISTEKVAPQARTWISTTDEHQKWPHSSFPTPGQGPQETDCLMAMAKLIILKKEAEFAAFRTSRPYQGQTLKIRVKPLVNQSGPRFGFIVPKKVLPKSTARNLVKRRLKSILQKHLSNIRPAAVLFFPSTRTLKLNFIELDKEAVQLFNRANIWKS